MSVRLFRDGMFGGGTADMVTSTGQLIDVKTVSPALRPLKELYKIVINSGLIQQEYSICSAIVQCYYNKKLTREEERALMIHFSKGKPSFFGKIRWGMHLGYNAYWWPRDTNGNKNRIKYINHLISKL